MSNQSRPEHVPLTVRGLLTVAYQHDITLKRKYWWYDHESRHGCAAGVAAILRDPRLVDYSLEETDCLEVLSEDEFFGLHAGFENHYQSDISPEFEHCYQIGSELRKFAVNP